MTLIFSGNNYIYETEGIMKLFIPAERFAHSRSDSPAAEGDYAFICEKQTEAGILLYVEARLGDSKASRELTLPADSQEDRELALSKLLYQAMSELTGIVPKWGVMTGVRPVKRVNRYIDSGMERSEMARFFKEQFYCSEEKFDIAYRTAQVQRGIMTALPEESFSLYVSIPFCPTRCSYCSFISQTVASGKKLIPEYIERLCEEIAYTAQLTKELGLRLDTVYFGGGTPTAFEATALERIMRAVSDSFDMSTVREYTVEAGRADTITREKLEVIRDGGATRLSVNPQTLSDNVLEAIGRKHTAAQFYEAFDLARSLGFDRINTDIIAGLPTDTPESFAATVEGLLKLAPENITVHTLSIKRAADLNYSDKKQQILTSPAGVMVDFASRRLTESGYSPYYLYRQKNMLDNLENIGWSREGCESLYNIFIMEEIQTILAVGAGASSKLVDLRNSRLERVFNYKHPLEYLKHFGLMLDKKKETVDFYAQKE
ncbi:MAG: coproporphyrinogen dehydrogenase HemZ [Ruminococcus sp.]|nr:coproporphyrinogen dehydrogenase HemZ [Ruminococcus sp.]